MGQNAYLYHSSDIMKPLKFELSDGESGEDSDGKRKGKNAKRRAAA